MSSGYGLSTFFGFSGNECRWNEIISAESARTAFPSQSVPGRAPARRGRTKEAGAAGIESTERTHVRTVVRHSSARDRDIEIESEQERETETGLPRFLGRFRNVLLSDEEMLVLQRELPGNWSEYIERLSEYMKSSGKSYQSHLATILRWSKEDAQKKLCAAQRNYSVRED